MTNGRANPLVGYLTVLAAAALWASSGTASKWLFGRGLSPGDVVQARVTLGTVSLALFLAVFNRAALRVGRRDLPGLAVLGGVMMAAVQLCYLQAIAHLEVAAAILIQYLSPAIVVAFAALFWKERLGPARLVALGLALLGCFLVSGAYDVNMLGLRRVGIAWGSGAAVLFAAYTLLGERLMARLGPWTVLVWVMAFAALVWQLVHPPLAFLRAGHDAATWGVLLHVGVLGTAVPYGLFFVGVGHVRASRASIVATSEPVFAGVFAAVLLGELLGPLQVLGGALVIAAVVLLQRGSETDPLAPVALRGGGGD